MHLRRKKTAYAALLQGKYVYDFMCTMCCIPHGLCSYIIICLNAARGGYEAHDELSGWITSLGQPALDSRLLLEVQHGGVGGTLKQLVMRRGNGHPACSPHMHQNLHLHCDK